MVKHNIKFPKHEPIGEPKGIIPGKVSWIHDRSCLNWKDDVPYWWDPNNFDEKRISRMIAEGLKSITETETEADAWNKIFKYHNKGEGYKPGERISIKVNMNGSGEWEDDHTGTSKMDYTNPILLKIFLTSLVEQAGVDPKNITVFDGSRIFPDYLIELCSSGNLKGIRFEGRDEAKPDYDHPIHWSEKFSKEVSYLPTCVTEADYLINLASLKGHFWGVTLLAKNHFGTIINSSRFRPPEAAHLHPFLYSGKRDSYSPLTDLLLNEQLNSKTILYMFDALICAQTEGTNITQKNSRWQQDPFLHDQTKSLFFSLDPIALDSVGIDLLKNEPTLYKYNSAILDTEYENYLHEAALLPNPPSKIQYSNGTTKSVESLGIHEHWTDGMTKHYQGNLGNTGIILERKEIGPDI